MYTVKDSIHIDAPVERCFLLSTSIDLMSRTYGLRPISGKMSGHVTGVDRVLWHGWVWGIPHLHETVITSYQWPEFFQDTMQRGRFRKFQHDHHFAEVDGQTFLHDKVRFSLPLGWFGKMVSHRLVIPFLARVLRRRFLLLKQLAESEDWRRYMPNDAL